MNKLTIDELIVIRDSIFACQYKGRDTIVVGQLLEKVMSEIKKLEKPPEK